MGTSDIYAHDANAFFKRNLSACHAFTTDHLLSQIDRRRLLEANVAEFGIGNGQNLFLLAEYARSVAGFEIGAEAVESVRARIESHPRQDMFSLHQVNLARPFRIEARFDLILFGFFAYYCDDSETAVAIENARAHLAQGGLVHLVDFLARSPSSKPDSRNPRLTVHKRDLRWWQAAMADFDMLDYRLWDTERTIEYRRSPSPIPVDPFISDDDGFWMFSALFRKRS
jgi:SAM-dependent methyltransferase